MFDSGIRKVKQEEEGLYSDTDEESDSGMDDEVFSDNDDDSDSDQPMTRRTARIHERILQLCSESPGCQVKHKEELRFRDIWLRGGFRDVIVPRGIY